MSLSELESNSQPLACVDGACVGGMENMLSLN